jgi:hypothetical protein
VPSLTCRLWSRADLLHYRGFADGVVEQAEHVLLGSGFDDKLCVPKHRATSFADEGRVWQHELILEHRLVLSQKLV